MEKKIIKHFNERLEEYTQKRELLPFPIDFKGRVLEVGCGAMPTYSIDNVDFYGVDITPNLIRAFKESYQSITLIICDAKFLPFKPSTFQLVVSTDLLHHLVGINPSKCFHNVRDVVSELNRVLYSENIFLIKDFLAKNYLYTLIIYFATLFCAKFNIEINSIDIHSKIITYFLTKKKLLSLLKENRFQIEEITLDEWKLKRFTLGSRVKILARAVI